MLQLRTLRVSSPVVNIKILIFFVAAGAAFKFQLRRHSEKAGSATLLILFLI